MCFLGDSLLRRLCHEHLRRRRGDDLVISGYTVADLHSLCQRWAVYLRGRKVVVCIGYNDYIQRTQRLVDVCWSMHALFTFLEEICASVTICTIPPYPMRGRRGLISLSNFNGWVLGYGERRFAEGGRQLYVVDLGRMFVSHSDEIRFQLYEQCGNRRTLSPAVKHWNEGAMCYIANTLRRFLYGDPPRTPTPAQYWIALRARLSPVYGSTTSLASTITPSATPTGFPPSPTGSPSDPDTVTLPPSSFVDDLIVLDEVSGDSASESADDSATEGAAAIITEAVPDTFEEDLCFPQPQSLKESDFPTDVRASSTPVGGSPSAELDSAPSEEPEPEELEVEEGMEVDPTPLTPSEVPTVNLLRLAARFYAPSALDLALEDLAPPEDEPQRD